MWKKDPCFLPQASQRTREKEGLGQIGDFDYWALEKKTNTEWSLPSSFFFGK